MIILSFGTRSGQVRSRSGHFPASILPKSRAGYPSVPRASGGGSPRFFLGYETLFTGYPRHFPSEPQTSPSARAGYPRQTPSRLWPANTTADISPTGLSQHFPKRSPALAREITDRPRAAYGPPTLWKTFPRPCYPCISPSVPQAGGRDIPGHPQTVVWLANITAGSSPTVFSLHFPKRARGVSQTVPEPSMALQHYGRHFPDRAFPAFPQRDIPDRPRAAYGPSTLRKAFPNRGFRSFPQAYGPDIL